MTRDDFDREARAWQCLERERRNNVRRERAKLRRARRAAEVQQAKEELWERCFPGAREKALADLAAVKAMYRRMGREWLWEDREGDPVAADAVRRAAAADLEPVRRLDESRKGVQ
jgi:hypothetical protein